MYRFLGILLKISLQHRDLGGYSSYWYKTDVRIDIAKAYRPSVLSKMHMRLQQVMDNYHHFGGINMLFVSDLPPSGKSSFIEAMIMLAVNHHRNDTPLHQQPDKTSPSCSRTICDLLSIFKCYHLVTQQWTRNDPTHHQFILDLANNHNIDSTTHLSNYKILSHDDISTHLNKWEFAPFLVSTNIERIQISYHQAKRFTIKHGTYLYKWPVNLYNWKNGSLST